MRLIGHRTNETGVSRIGRSTPALGLPNPSRERIQRGTQSASGGSHEYRSVGTWYTLIWQLRDATRAVITRSYDQPRFPQLSDKRSLILPNQSVAKPKG